MLTWYRRSTAALVLAAAFLFPMAPSAVAAPQKVARSYTEVPTEGFKFKALDRFDQVPAGGRGDDAELARFNQGRTELIVYGFEAQAAETGGDGEGETRRRRRRSIETTLRYDGFREARKAPTLDETVKIDGLDVRHRRFEWEVEGQRVGNKPPEPQPVFLELWTFPLSHAEVHFVYYVHGELDRRWEKAIEKSAESFEQIERVEEVVVDPSKRTYKEQLELAEQEAARTEGWRAIGTPSKRFVILTNAENQKFVKEVIKRLEVSRDIYEDDFPPPKDFNAVSIVRICQSRAEFQKFSGAGPGVAGYFSPATVELVLYDNVDTNRNSTYAVVSHEAFHQYCHFLFDQSEAHRWFDEGHGDYYGGMEISGRRGFITPKMPAGLNRLDIIRDMVKNGTTFDLEKHLNASHGEWQSGGVRSYSQSWSIIYYLRQGMIRKVNRKVWDKAYADIIPNYVETLNKGFQDAYEEIRRDRIERWLELEREKAEAEEREPSTDVPEKLKTETINRFMLDPRKKQAIWKKAMEASWGKIDLAEFEEDWKAYVDGYLK